MTVLNLVPRYGTRTELLLLVVLLLIGGGLCAPQHAEAHAGPFLHGVLNLAGARAAMRALAHALAGRRLEFSLELELETTAKFSKESNFSLDYLYSYYEYCISYYMYNHVDLRTLIKYVLVTVPVLN